MDETVQLQPLAQALGDPVRLMVLQHLMGGPTTVSELVSLTGSSQSNVSNHLAVLRQSRLVRAVKQGRQNVYEIRDERVAQLIEALSTLAGPAPKSVRESPALAKARTCYDHLAGQAGVQIFKVLLERGAVTKPETLRTLKNAGSPVALGKHGAEIFGALGIDVQEVINGRKPYAFGCRDWTEREAHLGGRLGAALWARFIELGWVERQAGTRAVVITPEGRKGIEKAFGISLAG